MKILNVLLFCLLQSANLLAQIPVFISGTDGHKSYRIPAIIKTPRGELIAFAEGRVNGSGDFGDINIVMKKSKDRGMTWGGMKSIVDYKDLQAGNPAPVVDITDPTYPGGRIFLFYNTGNNHEGEVRKGNGLREIWYITSTDGGDHWSVPINITKQTHRPMQPTINPEYDFNEDWRSYANTPGHAAQFTDGIYKGRIYVAANHSAGDPQPHFRDYASHGYYTDDHGLSFQLSETVPVPGSNEATATPLSNNRLMLNARNQQGDKKYRIVAISQNGGQSWNQTYFDQQLPDPVCEGSILSMGIVHGKHRLAFINAADTLQRDHLTLRISDDEGNTWKKSILVYQGSHPDAKSPSAYSDIVKVNNHMIGVLFERDNYSQIVFQQIRWK